MASDPRLHLHNLEGWAMRIEAMLSSGDWKPDRFDVWTFRPCEGARDALLYYAATYPEVIGQVREFLDFAEQQHKEMVQFQPLEDCPYCGAVENQEDIENIRHCWECGQRTELKAPPHPRLKASADANAMGAYDSLARAIRSAVSAIENAERKSPPDIVSPNDPRDEWIYHEVRKGRPAKEIERELEMHCRGNDWTSLSSWQAIRGAAKRYAKRKNLPPPPPRQQKQR